MYSPITQKEAAGIMYRKQLLARARSMPLGDLEAEIRNYEHQLETPDTRGFFKRILDELIGVNSEKWDQYQANKVVLRERTTSE